MGVIVPTILTASLDDIRAKLAKVKGLVESVQIDVVDGVFAGPPTWPYSQGEHALETFRASGETLADWGSFRFEIDLMVANPLEEAGAWLELGAQRVLIHFESVVDVAPVLAALEQRYGHEKGFPGLFEVGLATQIDTDLARLEEQLVHVDYVQFMGIATIGKQGQPFDPRVVEKIKLFRKAHPDVLIQVDGGVSLESAPALLSAGVDRLVIGSALWKSGDVPGTLEKLEELAESYGRYA